MRESQLYSKLDGDEKAVKCLTCAHYCKLADGVTGKCGVRVNENGVIKVLHADRYVSLSIGVMEDYSVTKFLPGAKALCLGVLGCNFKCTFCNTWDFSQYASLHAKLIGRARTNELLVRQGEKLPPKKLVDYAILKGAKAIVYSVTEPTIAFEQYIEVMAEAKKKGIANVWVTNGYFSDELLEKVVSLLDCVVVDLKSFSNEFYRKHCGAELSVVRRNIQRLHELAVHIEVTMPLIPDENDSEKEIRRAMEFLAGVSKDLPVHFLRFTPDFRMLDKPVTSDAVQTRAKLIAAQAGLRQ